MKAIDIINKIVYSITVILYLIGCLNLLIIKSSELHFAFIFAVYMMAALGFTQVILSLISLFYFKRIKLNSKKILISYWIIVIGFFIIINFLTELLFLFIPMCIASYFTYIIHNIRKNYS